MSKTIRFQKPKIRKGDSEKVRISKVHEERIRKAKEPKVEEGLYDWDYTLEEFQGCGKLGCPCFSQCGPKDWE